METSTVEWGDRSVRLRQWCDEVVAEGYAPGVGIAAGVGSRALFSESLGLADVSNAVPATAHTLYPIACVTKLFTSMCAMALADEGRLSLDARVAELLPDVRFHERVPGAANALMVRHLLIHTGGVGVVAHERDINAFVESRRVQSRPPAFGGHGLMIESAPGAVYCYTNLGYELLGEIIARAEGLGIEEAHQLRVFAPLGMRSTAGSAADLSMAATGHRAPSDDSDSLPGSHQVEWNNRPHAAMRLATVEDLPSSGAALSSLADMSRFAAALMTPDPALPTPGAMFEPRVQYHPELLGQAIGFRVMRFRGRQCVFHEGFAVGGWSCGVYLFPSERVWTVALMNALDAGSAYSRLLEALCGDPVNDRYEAPVEGWLLDALPGRYHRPRGVLTNLDIAALRTGTVSVTRSGGELVVDSSAHRWGGPTPLAAASHSDPCLLRIKDGSVNEPLLAAQRLPSGAVAGICIDPLQRLHRGR